jgi:hypothetical protein
MNKSSVFLGIERKAWLPPEELAKVNLLEAQELKRRLEFLEARVDLIIEYLGLKEDSPAAQGDPQ